MSKTENKIKMFVARPVRVGGSGFCFVPEGELVKFGCSDMCMIGVDCNKGTTAVRVEEVEACGVVLAFTNSIMAAWHLPLGEAQIEAENQVKEISAMASQFGTGTRVYTEKYHNSLRLTALR